MLISSVDYFEIATYYFRFFRKKYKQLVKLCIFNASNFNVATNYLP
jgi:hypothetical protein